MLGQPESPVAQSFRVLRQLQRVPEGLRRRAALEDGSEVENRQYHSAAPALTFPFFTASIVGPSLPRVWKSLVAEVENWKARRGINASGDGDGASCTQVAGWHDGVMPRRNRVDPWGTCTR
jgi:hypothetical protein